MSAHIERMKAEMAELDDKASKLAVFINSNPLFAKLDAADQDLMKRQLSHMEAYASVLDERLERAASV